MFDSYDDQKNPQFSDENSENSLTVSFLETRKKKLHIGFVAGMVIVWLLYVGYDRVVRVNLQKYHMKKALERAKIEQVEAGRRAKLLLNKSVRYKKVRKIRKVRRVKKVAKR